MKDLESYPLVMLGKNTITYSYYNELFSKEGLVLQPDTEVATSEQILPVIQAGLGIGFVPAGMAKEALIRKKVIHIPLKEKLPPRQVVLIQDRRRPMSVAVKTLLQVLAEN